MIVNTAYIYMGSGGAPVNPNLWQDGISNYPVEFTGGCSISADGLNFISTPGDATFSELPLKSFNSLTLSGRTSAQGMNPKVEIGIEFYSDDNVLIGTRSATFSKSGNSVTIDIPSSAKIQNANIKIKKAAYGYPSTLSSAMLS